MPEPTQDTQIVDQSPAVPAAAAMGLSPSSTPFPASSDTMRSQYDASVARRRARPEHDTGPRGSGQEANRGVETFDQWKERMYPAPIPENSGTAPVPQVNGTGRPPTGVAAGGRGENNNIQQVVRQEWLNAGYSPAAVEGIMRRVGKESKFDPFALGDYDENGNPTSISLYQHHADRATKLAKFLQENGARDGSDPVKTARLATQFAISEMNGGDPIAAKSRDELMHSTDPNQAYGLFTNSFERPKGAPGSEETNLRSTAMGPFSGQAKTLVDQALTKMNRDTSSHDEAMAEAKDMRSFERAAMARWMAQSEKPPKNMHDNWQQWGSIASIFALMGPLFGKRSATAALNAAGDMMQAANAADQHTYDQAYKQWKDHNDSMLKAVELFHGQYKEIIEADNKSWDHKQAEITTLLSAAGVVSRFDEQTFAKQEQALRIAKERADLTKVQNEDSEIRLSAEAKNQQYRDAHSGEEPPASVKNQNLGEATRERKGTGGIREEVDRQIYSTTYAARVAAGDPPEEAAKAAAAAVKDRGVATPAKGDEAAIQKAVASDMAKFDQDNPDAPKQDREKAEYESRLLHRQEMGAASRPPRSAPAMALQTFIQEKIKKDGRPPTADEIQTFAAVGAEKTREGTAVGTRSGNLAMASNAAEALIPLVRQTSEKINRTEFPNLNSMIVAVQKGTGGTDIVRFMEMINSLKYLYARALSPTGQARVADLANFDKIMSENWTKGQINAGLDQIQQSLSVERGAISKTRAEIAGGGVGAAASSQADTLQKPVVSEPMRVPPGMAGDPDGTGYRKDGKVWVKQGDYLIETPNAVETK